MKYIYHTIVFILMIILMATGVLSGCSTDDSTIRIIKTTFEDYSRFDPDLHPMIRRYEAHLNATGDLTLESLDSIKLVKQIRMFDSEGQLIKGVVGVCWTGSSTRIEIDSGFWWAAHRIRAEALGFHELAHCVQRRPHRSSMVSGSCPSIMHPYIQSSSILIRCWDTAIFELFHPPASLFLDTHDECHVQPDGQTACAIRGESNVDTSYDPYLLLN